MNNFKRTSLLLAVCLSALLVAGCTMDAGEVVEEHKNKTIYCVDARDGKTFSFNSNTIANARMGIGAHHTMDIVTDDGKKMTLSSNMVAWLKCN